MAFKEQSVPRPHVTARWSRVNSQCSRILTACLLSGKALPDLAHSLGRWHSRAMDFTCAELWCALLCGKENRDRVSEGTCSSEGTLFRSYTI